MFSENGPPFSSEALQKFLALQYIDHITSFPHYPWPNGFIEWQVKTIKTALDTAKATGKSHIDLLLSLRPTLIGPHLPSLGEILNNRTQNRPWQPSHPLDFKEVRDYLITQKSVQKKHHNRRHNTRDLPELHPGQLVLFSSPADVTSYIKGTITGPSTTPHSYMIEAQGRKYHHNRHHICPIHTDTTAFQRTSIHQCNPIPGPPQQDLLISGPSSNKYSPITGPSSRTPPQTLYSPQKDPVKQSKQGHIPALQSQASSNCSPVTIHL